jgi:tetraacyldisaccharide-1-P 4'-kinase
MPVPVIGVGSLWAGGVGKTPVTIAVARLLQESGVRVAVLTHGYGGSRHRTGALVDPLQHPDPAEVGDEAAELRLALPDVPIAVGKRRVRMAHAAMARWSPDALVLDDGFQHLPLARALDLVLLPAESPLGNGFCLPAGPLREPPEGVRRAGGVVWVGWETLPVAPTPTLPVNRKGGGIPPPCTGEVRRGANSSHLHCHNRAYSPAAPCNRRTPAVRRPAGAAANNRVRHRTPAAVPANG